MHYATSRLGRMAVGIFLLVALASVPQLFGETDFTVSPGRAASPLSVTPGPDHNLWFTESSGLKIGKITSAGVITEYPIAGAQALCGIAIGPDGNVWFTDEYAGTIGHISTSGTGLVTYALPAGSHPQGLAAGPDNKLWFVDQKDLGVLTKGGFRVGKISTTGQITEYATGIDAGVFDPLSYPQAQIASGPDGKLWFTNPQAISSGRSIVGKITTSGAITIYNMADVPLAIMSAPDGNLWATENGNVAKINTSGVETEYPLTYGGGPGITTGPDGNIWFNEVDTVGYVTPGGVLTEFPPSNYSASFIYMTGIATGSDGALWTLGSVTSNIGRVNTAGQLTNNYPLAFGSQVSEDTLGPDGAIWATQWIADQITRVDKNGVITTFPTAPGSRPGTITSGPDGNLWFLEAGTYNVAKMTTSGVITEYSVGQKFPGLWSIVTGPDGNLWFQEYAPRYNNIVRITPAGVMTNYPIPTQFAYPLYITKGPDGNLWFTELVGQQVGKIDPKTGQITEYPFPGSGVTLQAITAGPDGNLWIMANTEYGLVAKFSTSGVLLAEYPVEFETLLNIAAGSDGALWLPQYYPNGVARITTSGVVSTVPLTSPNAVPNGLAFGADGKIWVAEYNAGALGRLSAIGGTGDSIHATHGTPFSGAVASFVDGTPTATQGNFTAMIDWGDGVKNAGTVSGSTGGPFNVSGTHTYSAAGNFTLRVTLHDNVDNASYEASPGNAQVK